MEVAGSAEYFRAALEQSFEMFSDQNVTITSYGISGPISLYRTKGNRYAVVPTDMELSVSGRRVKSTGHQIGHYVEGLGWRYVSGDELGGSKVRTFFPDFPKGAEIPEPGTYPL